MEATDICTLSTLSIGLCGILFLIQLYYIFGVYNRIHCARRNTSPAPIQYPPISVIIVTKDSGKALEENLPAILEQDYPEFEVIVINDKSAGEDDDILKRLALRYQNLYQSFIPESARYVSRKKLGIAMGIRASRYEWLVFTEPYCRPTSKNWLKSMAGHFDDKTDIVLGYSNYLPQSGWFARKITTIEFFHSLRFLGSALAGRPYMGIGRNLAYRKSLYERHKGFSDHLQLQRGEDDLFINAVARKENTQVATEAESIVRMPVPPFKHIWYEEQMNHLVTGHYYKGVSRLMNAIETGTCILFQLTTLCALALSIFQQWRTGVAIAFLLWLIRFACLMMVFRNTAKDLQENLCCIFPFFDMARPFWSIGMKIRYLFRTKTDFMRR